MNAGKDQQQNCVFSPGATQTGKQKIRPPRPSILTPEPSQSDESAPLVPRYTPSSCKGWVPNFPDAVEWRPERRTWERAGCTCSPTPRRTIKNKPGLPRPPHPAPRGSHQRGRLVRRQSPLRAERKAGRRLWGLRTKEGGARGAARGEGRGTHPLSRRSPCVWARPAWRGARRGQGRPGSTRAPPEGSRRPGEEGEAGLEAHRPQRAGRARFW